MEVYYMNTTIDKNSLQILWSNEKTRKHAGEILTKIKYSKYGYNGDAGNETFLYWECDRHFAKALLGILNEASLSDLEGADGFVGYSLASISVEFITQLIKCIKA